MWPFSGLCLDPSASGPTDGMRTSSIRAPAPAAPRARIRALTLPEQTDDPCAAGPARSRPLSPQAPPRPRPQATPPRAFPSAAGGTRTQRGAVESPICVDGGGARASQGVDPIQL
ncbi:hypothetical protein P7K49_017023 [Saguinus oedipus]|uniref:Uncharacterized protein n=1 Tax=Saguinus oedipus TaxID=9490 RepID=A0ABQ9V1R4_SAGOE|nr:hypothetical protein P7K49_017023 [Saguinus oedipus]